MSVLRKDIDGLVGCVVVPQRVAGRAPVAILSAAKRRALLTCLNPSGGLRKKAGAWHGAENTKPISGVTVADLARDGMLTLNAEHRTGSAHLTERGMWFAQTLLDDGMPRTRIDGVRLG